jgi:nitroreductase
MFDKKAKTSVPVNDLIARRWSGRAYDAARPVSEEHITSLLEAARWSPSCFGDQPWRYIIFNKHKNRVAWDQAYSCLSEGNQSWAKDAPVLILSIADSIMSKTGKPNRWGQYDTGAATMSLCIQATELGLMVHQMGGFDKDKASELFSIPDQFIPMAMMTVGYQLPLDKIEGEIRNREFSERARNPLSQNFFEGTWGKPYTERN